MTVSRLFQVALEGLSLSKVRSFLTTLGIIIGVAAVIIMLAVSSGAEAEIADQINSLGANLIMIMPSFTRGGFGAGGPPPGLTFDDLEVLAGSLTNINGVSAEEQTSQNVKAGSTIIEDVSVVGTTTGFAQVRDYDLAAGRFLDDQDNDRTNKVVVLGSSIAADLFGEPSSAVNQKVRIGSYQFTVVGIMADKGVVGNTDYDARVYIPLTVYFEKFNWMRFRGSNTVRLVYVSAASKEAMADVMAQLPAVLYRLLGTDATSPGFSLTTQDNIITAQASTTESFRNLLGWVAGISLVVGGIGIMNIMLVSVTERTREIGLRQALGARPRDVRLQFLLEAVILSLVGGLVGVLVGVGGSYLFNALGSMRTELVPASIPLAFAAAAAVGIFFGYYPATKAAQLDPIEALRHE